MATSLFIPKAPKPFVFTSFLHTQPPPPSISSLPLPALPLGLIVIAPALGDGVLLLLVAVRVVGGQLPGLLGGAGGGFLLGAETSGKVFFATLEGDYCPLLLDLRSHLAFFLAGDFFLAGMGVASESLSTVMSTTSLSGGDSV